MKKLILILGLFLINSYAFGQTAKSKGKDKEKIEIEADKVVKDIEQQIKKDLEAEQKKQLDFENLEKKRIKIELENIATLQKLDADRQKKADTEMKKILQQQKK